MKRNSAVLKTILKAFVPYSKENVMLAYKPGKFFSYIESLENQTGASRTTISATISRAKRAGLISMDKNGNPTTTWRGKIKAGLVPKTKTRKLLIIVFDIPEYNRKKRDIFRRYLNSTHASQVQKSVWKTQYDIYDELLEVIDDLSIGSYVNLFMADELKTDIPTH